MASGVRRAWIAGLVAVTAFAAGPARADEMSRSVRDAAARLYRTELLDLAKSSALDNDAPAYERAHEVYARVQRAAIAWFPETGDWEWELHLAADLDGAWSAPGCKLMVGAPLVHRLARNDAALAFVIGHEVAHCVMDHSRDLIDAMIDGEPRLARLQARDLLSMIDGDVRTVLRLAPVSRRLEDEADRLGVILAATAGYDPARMGAYFDSAGEAGGLLSGTHADRARRASTVQSLLPVARRLYEGTRR